MCNKPLQHLDMLQLTSERHLLQLPQLLLRPEHLKQPENVARGACRQPRRAAAPHSRSPTSAIRGHSPHTAPRRTCGRPSASPVLCSPPAISLSSMALTGDHGMSLHRRHPRNHLSRALSRSVGGQKAWYKPGKNLASSFDLQRCKTIKEL